MTSLSVIIPSRARDSGTAIGAVDRLGPSAERTRMAADRSAGRDRPGGRTAAIESFDFPVKFINASARSGSAAVNAAAATATGDYVAFLEDDDVWDPDHLEVSLRTLEHAAFVSGTQLEVDDEGTVVRINDFPTPTGWVMRRSTWGAGGAIRYWIPAAP